MHAVRTSEIIAHFIGHFDAPTEEARVRLHHKEGQVETVDGLPDASDAVRDIPFASSLDLNDYEPGVDYKSAPPAFSARPLRPTGDFDLDGPGPGRHPGEGHAARPPHAEGYGWPAQETDPTLTVHDGPGSAITHMVQVNLLRDDDVLDMTDGPAIARDMTFVTEQLNEQAAAISAYLPFSTHQRTDTYEGLSAIADDIHDFAETMATNETTGFNSEAEVDFVLTGKAVAGAYVNGQAAETLPVLADMLPDRGLAASQSEPEPVDGDLAETNAPADTLTVESGANLIANIATFTDTGVIAPVMSVMGDYRQIDVITQAYSWSDRDVTGADTPSAAAEAETLAMNIADFQRESFDTLMGRDQQATTESDPVFPHYWRVSEVEGDVYFVKWLEQYNFVTDNDSLVVTTTGTDTTVLVGGDTAINLASFLGISFDYDLIIVGGDVLDMNVISQVAILYDNDWVDADAQTNVTTSGNLLWNQATINNVGLSDRFETMPDYMTATRDAIEARDGRMPDGLATDANFAGQNVLDVLYITGNLYDVTYIRQVSLLGDADHVTQAAADYLTAAGNAATVEIATGGNAIVNLAGILDYDTFGETNYLAGGLYSDAVLIQGGIIADDGDNDEPQMAGDRLANEVIAFLDNDDEAEDNAADTVFHGDHDLSLTLSIPADAMQTVLA